MRTSIGIGLTGIPRGVRGGGRKPGGCGQKPAGVSAKANIPGVRLREKIGARQQEILARIEELRASGDEWLAQEADFWEGLEGRKQ